MKNQIFKNVVSWGNGAGVLLPREWKNKEVKIVLIDRTAEIKKEVFCILEDYFENVRGVYLVGSYARGEQTEKSDIDILVITNKINKRIERGKYNLILVSFDNFKKQLEKNIFPLLPMIVESKAIINASLIEKYKNVFITKKNVRFHIETTKSTMKVNKNAIKLAQMQEKNVSDAIAYSLILRLRGIYIFECLYKKKSYNNKDFLALIKKITGSLEAYEGYLRVKNNEKIKEILFVNEAVNISDYIVDKIKEQEKWVKKRKS